MKPYSKKRRWYRDEDDIYELYVSPRWIEGVKTTAGISPLACLTKLEFLCLSFNEIRDISPLANLTELKRLILTDNPISDFSQVDYVESVGY
jgi:Leucine-rich repeat (LRR) protein